MKLYQEVRNGQIVPVSIEIENEKEVEFLLDQLRPKGEWIEGNSETGALGIKYTWFRCNQCGWNSSLVIPKNFCPNCGADMRTKGGNE